MEVDDAYDDVSVGELFGEDNSDDEVDEVDVLDPIAALVRGTVVQLSSCECALSQRPSSTSSSRWNASSDRERSVFRTGCSGDDPRPASCPRARVQRRESIARSQATSFRRFASVLVLAGTKLGMATVPHMKDGARASFPR